VIPAGGSGKLVATVHTHAQENGHISKTIRVVTDDPGLKQLLLRLNATVIAPIEVRPSSRIWLSTWEDVPAKVHLLLHRQDGKPLKIMALQVEPPGLMKLTWSSVTSAERVRGLRAGPGDVWLTASVQAVPHAISRSGKVHITTNDPRQKTFILPLFVQVRPTLEAVPPQLRFFVGDRGPQEYWRVVELRAHGSTRFHIRSVQTDRPALFKVVIMPPGLGTSEKIRIGLDRDAALKVAAGTFRSTMTIKTDDAKHPVMTIPVIVTRQRAMRVRPTFRVLRPKTAPAQKKPGEPQLPPPGSGPGF